MDRTTLVRNLAVLMVGALSVQFVLGIYVNLFVSIPEVSSGTPGSMMSGAAGAMMGPGVNPAFIVHMLLGMLLVLFGMALVVIVTRSELGAVAVTFAGVGLGSLFVAAYGGMSFVMSGQNDALSFTMAIGFIFAMAAYVAVLTTSTLGQRAPWRRLRTS